MSDFVVVDASALVALLLNGAAAERVRLRLAEAQSLHAPHLIDLEVAQVFRRAARRQVMDEEEAGSRLRALQVLPLRRYPHAPFLERIWALRHTLTAYDAAYIALAEALDAPLITLDEPLSRAHGHGAVVEWLG